jgi:DNA-binding NarL/FixJ family response regulator
MIRILLVDDQRSIRETLKMMLDSAPDFQVVGTASDGHTAIEQVGLLNPDVVLIDMEMPGLDGVSATRIINQQFSEVKVLVLSMHDDDAFISQSMQAGAMGYLLKNTPPQELRAAIRFVKRGYAQIGPGLLDKMVSVEEHENHDLRNGHGTAQFDTLPQSNGALSQNQHRQTRQLTKTELLNLESNGNGHARRHPSSELSISSYESEQADQAEQDTLRKNRWKRYLLLGLIINAFLWMAAIAVLKYKRPVYTSAWTLDLPASRSDTFLEVPGVGRAAETNVSPYSNIMVADPRANYKDLISTSEVIKAAANIVHVPVDEFVPPRVEVVANTTLIKLSVNGKSPRDAYQNAIAVQSAFNDKITALRQQVLKWLSMPRQSGSSFPSRGFLVTKYNPG